MSRNGPPPEQCRPMTQTILIGPTRMPPVMRPISTQKSNGSLAYQALLSFVSRETELKVNRLNQSAQ